MPTGSKMHRLIYLGALFSVVWILSGCNPPVQEIKEADPDPLPEQFIRANQYMYQRHQDHISAFVERTGWQAETTSSGLWVVVEKKGSAPCINENSRVSFAFESTLLDGSPCYSASSQNPKVIVVGKGGVETGVEQGIRRLCKGSEAVFLIPPHLAHGNFGDREKIPGNAVLIYRIHILEVEQGS